MHGDPALWYELMDRLADLAIASLRSQVDAGAPALQLFDSWAGALGPADYERFVLPASRRVLDGVADLGVPRIHFGVDTGELLGLMADGRRRRGRRRLADPARRRPHAGAGRRAPCRATSTRPLVRGPVGGRRAEPSATCCARNGGHPGHVFNLGHGVLPETDPDGARAGRRAGPRRRPLRRDGRPDDHPPPRRAW